MDMPNLWVRLGGRGLAGRLDGKVAIITGGARGQGEAEARLFVSEGAKVVIADVLEEAGQAVAESLGDAARFERLDVTDESNWKQVVASASEHFGTLTTLINNAGIVHFSAFEETSLDDYLRVIHVNQVGTFLGMKTAVPSLVEAGGGERSSTWPRSKARAGVMVSLPTDLRSGRLGACRRSGASSLLAAAFE